jgi:hypothetical protein
VLVPVQHQTRNGLVDNLTVIIGQERLIFLVDAMKVVGSVGTNRATLQRLFPRSLRVVGPDELIDRVKSPSTGKALTIEGLLYTGSRTFFLLEVDEEEDGR